MRGRIARACQSQLLLGSELVTLFKLIHFLPGAAYFILVILETKLELLIGFDFGFFKTLRD